MTGRDAADGVGGEAATAAREATEATEATEAMEARTAAGAVEARPAETVDIRAAAEPAAAEPATELHREGTALGAEDDALPGIDVDAGADPRRWSG